MPPLPKAPVAYSLTELAPTSTLSRPTPLDTGQLTLKGLLRSELSQRKR